MRPIWTGGISFGLIYIPVKLYSATQSVQIDLDMLSKKDLAPIKYARIDSETGKEVPWKDIVKGYQYSKGDYVILTDEDFEKVDIHKSKSIEISSFVDRDEIDPIYFDKPYYLEPDKEAGKTYELLVQALKKSNKVGVAEFVLRDREHLCILKPEGNVLILNQMRYESEIKPSSNLEIPKGADISEKEMKMAQTLIDSMSDKFDAGDYRDDYINGLKKIIEAKKHHKSVKSPAKAPKATKSSDLMEELRKSLEASSRKAKKEVTVEK